MKTLVARFDDVERAADAMGALIDHGVAEASMDLVANETQGEMMIKRKQNDQADRAKGGITTTTAGDAKKGAAEGGITGLALGALAGLASIVIPGYGIVVGGGALATAVAAALGTGVAGAAAGAVTGYLKDLGVEDQVVKSYEEAIENGGGVLTVTCTHSATPGIVGILKKYQADRVIELDTARASISA